VPGQSAKETDAERLGISVTATVPAKYAVPHAIKSELYRMPLPLPVRQHFDFAADYALASCSRSSNALWLLYG
jgi:hypothetical protein